jgi:hypothetical protein
VIADLLHQVTREAVLDKAWLAGYQIPHYLLISICHYFLERRSPEESHQTTWPGHSSFGNSVVHSIWGYMEMHQRRVQEFYDLRETLGWLIWSLWISGKGWADSVYIREEPDQEEYTQVI